ncbi:hypothetical protein V8J36_17080 [Frigidibacter sp. MR17.14]|uniref:hypothetical protein n=1 Tax=Frigidibacter sp. MR17.14 TaxID=3126509 RepID=UPI003012A70B
MVDAGRGPNWLHVEYGNTPWLPDIVAVFAERAVFEGSQATLRDGATQIDSLGAPTCARRRQAMPVERRLSELLRKRNLANGPLEISRPDEVRMGNILQVQQAVPGPSFDLHGDGSLAYRLTLAPGVYLGRRWHEARLRERGPRPVAQSRAAPDTLSPMARP